MVDSDTAVLIEQLLENSVGEEPRTCAIISV